MKTRIAAWIAAIFMGAAFTAMPTLDSQDQYLQTTQTETAAERVAKLDQQASQEAAELARQYQEMDDREIMRGVVYEPAE
ncbi:hypothetical protein [Eikenella sp. HMSC061C02]|uniref:hypothetical protein n=1 Tax=Eikenella sp. HMSC061C02 TaxID=1715021 RepID=UPI0008A56DB6|nr:hypothetical protein [Eikenella sp. HMSC061C02]OFN57634.1 hypothetical protein HMPREF2541_11360 [Eikenella sp. HMSC061C02]